MDLSSEITKLLWPIVISFSVIWAISRLSRGRKFPPGPFSYPIIGNIQVFTKSPHKLSASYAKKYGNIMGGHILHVKGIAINDFDTAKQILNHPASFSRPVQFVTFLPGLGGFGGYAGEKWHEERKVVVSIMKSLGMGKGEWETMLHNETTDFLNEIKSWSRKPTDFLDPLDISVVSSFISLLVGRRITKKENAHEADISIKFVRLIMAFMTPSRYGVYLPNFMKRLLRWMGNDYMNTFYQSIEDFDDFLRSEVKRSSLNLTEKPTFITCYLQEMENQKKNSKGHILTVDALVGDISALFLGGVDTIRVSLQWLMLVIAAHPDVQAKIHAEIDAVAGSDCKIYWDDRSKFPYTMATINETERWVAVTPFYIPRDTCESMEIGDYVIPKGTGILCNWWAMTRDEKYFKNPDDFLPERFLNSDKTRLLKLDGFIPFSYGKRSCPGKHIGMMTVFLYITSLLQKFKLTAPEGKNVSFKDMGIGATINPIRQELCFLER